MALDLADPDAVTATFVRAAEAARCAACRDKSIDRIHPPGSIIATGDLHDNPMHLDRLIEAARLQTDQPRHLVLHEIIHSDRLINGMDFSYRALAKVAALKAAHPEHVHVLLANHELAQLVNAGIVKEGIRVVEAFNAGVEYAFGAEAPRIGEAIGTFIRAMPLALRCECPTGDILIAHSLPSPWMMARFDPSILTRDLTDADYESRAGSAYLMVWGRNYDADQIEDLVERWHAAMFILGHEHVENGVKFIPPAAIVLNSDHARGVYLPFDLSRPPRAEQAMEFVVPLAQ